MLTVHPFSVDLLPEVADFHCGNEVWDVEVSDWIKGPLGGRNSALTDMDRRKHPAEVWLHGDDDGNVVAFSSLAGATWKKYDRPISLIPNVAVATPHQGKGYFSEILKFLFTRARNDEDRINAVGLYVHPQNVNAISLYEHKGFHKTGDTWKDKETGVKYVQMAVHI